MKYRLQTMMAALHRWLIRGGFMSPPQMEDDREKLQTKEQQAARRVLWYHSLQYPPTPGRW